MSEGPSIAVVGGGFGGVGAAVMLKREGYEDVTVFEKSDRIGGVWRANTYPGAACDIPSHLYEFSFAPNSWSRRFSPGPEIRAYIEGVARHFGVLERIRTGIEVKGASWDEQCRKWRLETSAGPHEADVLVTACGQLSAPKVPPLAGLEAFEGPAFHTAEWRHDVDLAGKRVALIGTGCSAIQVGPAIQPEVAQLDVYQRSPGWTLAKGDFAYTRSLRAAFRRLPMLHRLDRASVYAFQDLAAAAFTRYRWLLPLFRMLGMRQINAAISDSELRRKVTPSHEFGCKRVMLTDDWYPTLTRDNVELVAEGVDGVTPSGIRDSTGVERPADAIVFATGFASHDFVAPMAITGSDGLALESAWAEVARAYLGLSVPGFPNMFLLYGPNTNGGSGSVVNTIECGVGHLLAALREMERVGASRIEVSRAAAEDFDRELRAALAGTVWQSGCHNWYVDENGNDPNNWPWTWTAFRRRTRELAPGAYELARAP
ncbi:MAG TPA: NAD(P)/FAD-dependent oxidoreductase [Solirubrobacterales bacterium]|nr:NAD(P)/FAD-dependent oxidoreductase [Solirubrobacterales bacterium]